jgi:hypothetical protein
MVGPISRNELRALEVANLQRANCFNDLSAREKATLRNHSRMLRRRADSALRMQQVYTTQKSGRKTKMEDDDPEVPGGVLRQPNVKKPRRMPPRTKEALKRRAARARKVRQDAEMITNSSSKPLPTHNGARPESQDLTLKKSAFKSSPTIASREDRILDPPKTPKLIEDSTSPRLFSTGESTATIQHDDHESTNSFHYEVTKKIEGDSTKGFAGEVYEIPRELIQAPTTTQSPKQPNAVIPKKPIQPTVADGILTAPTSTLRQISDGVIRPDLAVLRRELSPLDLEAYLGAWNAWRRNGIRKERFTWEVTKLLATETAQEAHGTIIEGLELMKQIIIAEDMVVAESASTKLVGDVPRADVG